MADGDSDDKPIQRPWHTQEDEVGSENHTGSILYGIHSLNASDDDENAEEYNFHSRHPLF